jgi:uncharacterized membrane protein
MNIKTIGWFAVTLASLTVAGYAVTLLMPELRYRYPLTSLAHFAGSALALAIGGFQLHARLRARFAGAHRWLGRLYVVGVAVGGISGFIMALQSSGGPIARAGFGLGAVIWLASTANAYRHIRAGNLDAHRRWMVRSFALTFAAVTLRVYLPISQKMGIPFPVAYAAIAWLAWAPNLLIAEWLLRVPGHAASPSSLRFV